MPQTFTKGPNAASVQQALGYKPQRPISAESPVAYDGSTGDLSLTDGSVGTAALANDSVTFAKLQNLAGTPPSLVGRSTAGAGDAELITLDSNNLALNAGVLSVTSVPSVTFGTGAPGGTPANGALYFDDTLPIYSGYIGRAGVWKQFS